MPQVRDEHAAGMSTKRSKRKLRDESEREHGVGGMKARTLPPVPFQPGLPQRHLRVPRQHLEGGRLPGAVHPQEAEALGRAGGQQQPRCRRSPAVPPAPTSPAGMARHSRSTAGARRCRYTCGRGGHHMHSVPCPWDTSHRPSRGTGGSGRGSSPGHAPWSGPSAAARRRAAGNCPPSPAPGPRPGPRPPAGAAAEPGAWG